MNKNNDNYNNKIEENLKQIGKGWSQLVSIILLVVFPDEQLKCPEWLLHFTVSFFHIMYYKIIYEIT